MYIFRSLEILTYQMQHRHIRKNSIESFIYCLSVGVQCRKTLGALRYTRQGVHTLRGQAETERAGGQMRSHHLGSLSFTSSQHLDLSGS